MRSKLIVSGSGFLTACIVAVSLAGCGGSADTSSGQRDSSPSTIETAVPTTRVEATTGDAIATDAPSAAAPDGGGTARPRHHGPFAELEAMDLRPEQRAKLEVIQSNVKASFEAIHREGRELALLLASSLDGGRLDETAVRAKRLAFEAQVEAARSAFADAANAVHATLDADQRTELVLTLRAKREGRPAPTDAATSDGAERKHHERGVSGLASELGLSAEQTRAIRDGARSIVEAAFPDRKARREKMEAEVKAAEEAFMTGSFDAHDYSFGKDATQWLNTATKGATALTDLAASVLTQGQRAALAQKIREGAAER